MKNFEEFLKEMWKIYINEKKLRKCTEQIAKQGYEGQIKPIETAVTVAVLRNDR